MPGARRTVRRCFRVRTDGLAGAHRFHFPRRNARHSPGLHAPRPYLGTLLRDYRYPDPGRARHHGGGRGNAPKMSLSSARRQRVRCSAGQIHFLGRFAFPRARLSKIEGRAQVVAWRQDVRFVIPRAFRLRALHTTHAGSGAVTAVLVRTATRPRAWRPQCAARSHEVDAAAAGQPSSRSAQRWRVR
jgi:hypothetical protein